MSELAVVTDAMRRHATCLDGLADRGVVAVRAGREVSTPGDAYGVLCSFIGAALVPVQRLGVLDAEAAVGSLRAMADQVRVVAAGFDTTDAAVTRALDVLDHRLGGER